LFHQNDDNSKYKWKKVVFKGERKVVPSCLISVMIAEKLIRKGCPTFLAYMRETKKMSVELASIPIVREYLIST
jgi:hypothetical protein